MKKSVNNTFNLFINLIMKKGKKALAINFFLDCLYLLKKRTNKEPLVLIEKAISNVQPFLNLKKKKVKGRKILVPFYYNQKVRKRIAIKWIIESAVLKNKKGGSSFSSCLCDELIASSKKLGLSIKKRNELHEKVLEQKSMLRYWP